MRNFIYTLDITGSMKNKLMIREIYVVWLNEGEKVKNVTI